MAKQSKIKNQNDLKFRINEYLLTTFYTPSIEPQAGNKVKEKKIQSLVPILLLSRKTERQASKQTFNRTPLKFYSPS